MNGAWPGALVILGIPIIVGILIVLYPIGGLTIAGLIAVCLGIFSVSTGATVIHDIAAYILIASGITFLGMAGGIRLLAQTMRPEFDSKYRDQRGP